MERGRAPFQRPSHLPILLWEAFGWGGNTFPPKELADAPGFTGQVLLAKAYRWYDETYGDKLKTDFGPGKFAMRLGNANWRVRLPRVLGQAQIFVDRDLKNEGTKVGVKGPASANVLNSIEGMTQGFASRLSEEDLQRFFKQFHFIFETIQWLDDLPTSDLSLMARDDYGSSTDEFMAERFGQSRWASQQALEKYLKALLTIGDTKFPTSGKSGHSLSALAKLLIDHHKIEIPQQFIQFCECSPAARYGQEPSTEDQALRAHDGVMLSLNAVRCSPAFAALLANK